MRRGRTLGEAASDVRAALAEFIEQLRRAGHSVGESVRLGALLRLRPKLMTASVAMAALVPMATGRQGGGEILQPLAIVVLGGMPPWRLSRRFWCYPLCTSSHTARHLHAEPTAAKLSHDMPSTR
jgi:hypothetical protein